MRKIELKEYKKRWYLKNKEDISRKAKEKYRKNNPLPEKEYIPDGYKKCTNCGEIKPITSEYFGKLSKSKDGFRYQCKECRRLYYSKNKDDIIEKSNMRYADKKDEIAVKNKIYRQKNTEWYKEYDSKYYKKNTSKIKENVKNYRRNRAKIDPEFRLLCRCRTRVYQALKGNIKSKPTMELIGCSVEELKSHLEKQFTNGMNWDNYGKWHVDHIIPCASFDFTKPEQQKECFNYSNLQPLWAEDNLRKSAKMLGDGK